MRRLLVCAMALAACGRKSEQKNNVVDEVTPSPPIAGFSEVTQSEEAARLAKSFPKGLPAVDPHSGIGVPPAPPANKLDLGVDWIAQMTFEPPITVDKVRAAANADKQLTFVLVDKGGTWEFLDDDMTGSFPRVAVEVLIVSEGVKPAAEIDGDIARANAFFARLDTRTPTVPYPREQLVANAERAVAFAKKYQPADAPQLDLAINIVAPAGKNFTSRAIWEAAYAAGFHWGDGDYFYLSHPDADVSESIGMSGTTATGYFLPEWVATNDPRGDASALDLSMTVPRTSQPDVALGVMVRAARYMAQRLGGTVVDENDKPYDEKAERARLAEMLASMRVAGLEPASPLALRVF